MHRRSRAVVTDGGVRSMPIVHCDACCLRVSTNKDKTLPKHYLEQTKAWTAGQKEC